MVSKKKRGTRARAVLVSGCALGLVGSATVFALWPRTPPEPPGLEAPAIRDSRDRVFERLVAWGKVVEPDVEALDSKCRSLLEGWSPCKEVILDLVTTKSHVLAEVDAWQESQPEFGLAPPKHAPKRSRVPGPGSQPQFGASVIALVRLHVFSALVHIEHEPERARLHLGRAFGIGELFLQNCSSLTALATAMAVVSVAITVTREELPRELARLSPRLRVLEVSFRSALSSAIASDWQAQREMALSIEPAELRADPRGPGGGDYDPDHTVYMVTTHYRALESFSRGERWGTSFWQPPFASFDRSGPIKWFHNSLGRFFLSSYTLGVGILGSTGRTNEILAGTRVAAAAALLPRPGNMADRARSAGPEVPF